MKRKKKRVESRVREIAEALREEEEKKAMGPLLPSSSPTIGVSQAGDAGV